MSNCSLQVSNLCWSYLVRVAVVNYRNYFYQDRVVSLSTHCLKLGWTQWDGILIKFHKAYLLLLRYSSIPNSLLFGHLSNVYHCNNGMGPLVMVTI